MTKIKCTVCGTEFEAQRSTARFCSDKCRVSANRAPEVTEEKKSVSKVVVTITKTDEKIETPVKIRVEHVCSPEYTPPCWYKDPETGKERVSKEHWAWLTDGGPSELLLNPLNPTQKDCKAGKLQEDGSRKILVAGEKMEEAMKKIKTVKL